MKRTSAPAADTSAPSLEPDPAAPRGGHGPAALAFIVLVALPLSSSAALLGGTPGATWPELVALPVWFAALLAGREAWSRAARGVAPAFLLYAGGVCGGLAIVLLREHQLASSAFTANLGDALARWFGAWSTTDSMFPLRSAAIYLAGPLFFVAVRSVFRSGPASRPIRGFVLCGGVGAALIAVAQAISGRGLSYELIPGAVPFGRAPGPLPDPNALASYLALVAAFGAVVWATLLRRSGERVEGRRIATAAAWASVLFAGLWVSGSRAAFGALAGIVLLAAVAGQVSRRSPGVKRRLLVAAFATMVVLVGLVALATLRGVGSVPDQSRLHRLLSAFDLSQPSMTLLRGRPALWAAGTTMFLDEPVTGVGPGRFGMELGPRLPARLWGAATAENAHNYYLQATAEIGAIGFAGLALLLTAAFVALWRQREEPFRRAALFGAGAWCVTCFAGHPQLVPSLQLFFWGFLGIATAGLQLPRVGPRRALLLVPVALLAGRIGQEVATGPPGPAFYAAGLHERETPSPGEETVRWTSGRAELALRRQGTQAEIRFLLAHEQMPVTVRLEVRDWREERHFYTGGWQSLRYWVPPGGAEIVTVRLGVTPLLVAPGDRRELGVALAPIRWRDGPLDQPVGAYEVETGADGRRFQWAAGVACFPLVGRGDLDIELRADNPDLEQEPLQVSLVRGDAEPQLVMLADRDWRRVRVPGAADADVLCVQSSRTWNPRMATGSADDRDLGVAVALPEAASDVVGAAR